MWGSVDAAYDEKEREGKRERERERERERAPIPPVLDLVSQICDVVLVRRTFSSGKP
jgi:hypothetical protein